MVAISPIAGVVLPNIGVIEALEPLPKAEIMPKAEPLAILGTLELRAAFAPQGASDIGILWQ